MTERYAFKMFLNPGAAEHRRRHEAIWPELVCLLTEAGVTKYSIHLDQEMSILFAYLESGEDHRMEALPDHPVMRRWWDHMRTSCAPIPTARWSRSRSLRCFICHRRPIGQCAPSEGNSG